MATMKDVNSPRCPLPKEPSALTSPPDVVSQTERDAVKVAWDLLPNVRRSQWRPDSTEQGVALADIVSNGRIHGCARDKHWH